MLGCVAPFHVLLDVGLRSTIPCPAKCWAAEHPGLRWICHMVLPKSRIMSGTRHNSITLHVFRVGDLRRKDVG